MHFIPANLNAEFQLNAFNNSHSTPIIEASHPPITIQHHIIKPNDHVHSNGLNSQEAGLIARFPTQIGYGQNSSGQN